MNRTASRALAMSCARVPSRLADPGDGRFVGDDKFAVPPMARLRELECFARKVDSGEKLSDKEEDEELALLVAPGSSLGGARPKANFRADDGMLWIAKFPGHNDRWTFVLGACAESFGQIGANLGAPERLAEAIR